MTMILLWILTGLVFWVPLLIAERVFLGKKSAADYYTRKESLFISLLFASFGPLSLLILVGLGVSHFYERKLKNCTSNKGWREFWDAPAIKPPQEKRV